jgi:class 3 adenylate cyclase/tetratricopeptide (TPR) repeat protein
MALGRERSPLEDSRTRDDELDDLLARAVAASQRVTPEELEAAPPDPQDVVSAEPPTQDELRRLTIMFSDLVGSTALSARSDPETYRGLVAAYKDTCRRVIEDQLDGHLVHVRGDGLLAVFGYPTAHEDDAHRAVRAGLEIHRALAARPGVSGGVDLQARIGVHRGLVYVERQTEELYGFAVNVAARIQELAAPGTVAISEEVRQLVAGAVRTTPLESADMKGVQDAPLVHQVLEEHVHPSRSVDRWPAPLVGRDDALGALRAVHERAATSEAPVGVLISGDPGIGKSRLVGAFLDELPSALTVVELGASPFHTSTGLHPVREVLLDRAEVRREQPSSLRLVALRDHLEERGLGHLLRALAPVAGIGPEAGYEALEVDPRKLQEEIAAAVVAYLADCFDAQPGLLVVEDLHWLDESTKAVVASLLTEGPAGLTVLLTSRHERGVGVTVDALRLDALDRDACEELIRHHDPEIDVDTAAEVVGRSDGIPLFIEELVRSRHHDDPNLGPGMPDEASVPLALYEPLYARLNTLPEARVVVSAAATIGRTVHLDLLAQVSGVSSGDLDSAVSTLVAARVLEHDHGDGRVVRFCHELVRTVAYELAPPSGRQRLHSLVAQSLLAGQHTAGIDWGVIAEHHRLAGQQVAAAIAFERAADDARLRGCLAEARASFDRALTELVAAPPDTDRDRVEVRLRLNRAFVAVSSEGYGSDQAADDYRRCLELCVDRPASDDMYRTLIAMWGYCLNRSDHTRAWAISTALRGLSQGVRAPMLPTNTAGFGMIEWYRGRFGPALALLEEAVAAVDQVGVDDTSVPSSWTMPADPLASMHIYLALVRATMGDQAGARQQEQLALARCRSLPFPLGPFTRSYAMVLQALIRAEEGDPAAARDLADEACAISEHHGFDAWLFATTIMRRMLQGMTEPEVHGVEAAAEVSMSVQLWDAIGVRALTGMFQSMLARLLLQLGDRDGAMTAAKEALATSSDTGSAASLAEAHRVLALAGPAEHAEVDLLRALDLAEEQGAALIALRIATDLVRMAGPAHRDRLAAAVARIPSNADHPQLRAAREVLATG